MSVPESQFGRSGTLSAAAKDIIVGVADLKYSRDTGTNLVTYALGSCLGITFYDPRRRVGGLLHAMLPDSNLHQGQVVKIPMFIDSGLRAMLDGLTRMGASVASIECKVFGGAQVMSADKFFNIGDRNIRAFNSLAQSLGLRVLALEVGGQVNRTIKLSLEHGQVSVRTPNQPLFWR